MNDKTKDRAKTKYTVLQRTQKADPGAASSPTPRETWQPLATIDAANSQDAIRQAAKGAEGVYVAVPARSWQPVTVKVETRTVVKLT